MPEMLSPADEATLLSIYEEIRWLAARPSVTVGMARAWYASIRAEPLKRRIRQFSGMVSEKAASALVGEPLILEHYGRMHASISDLIKNHLVEDRFAPEEFVRTVLEVERVHIVIQSENVDARLAKGDYAAAGIQLLSWGELPSERQNSLWQTMLQGKVANAKAFVITGLAQAKVISTEAEVSRPSSRDERRLVGRHCHPAVDEFAP